MADLKTTLRQEVEKYAGNGWGYGVRSFAISNDEQGVYAVNWVSLPNRTAYHGISVLARLLNGLIIIDVDNTNKPLVEDLLAHGIPRDKIILAYDGEAVPEQPPTQDALNIQASSQRESA